MAKAKGKDARTLVLRALVNKDEKQRIEKAAKGAGLSVSSLLRIRALPAT